MMEVCDTISVLRDGEVIDTRSSKEFTIPELQKEMIGREVSGDYYRDDMKEDYSEELVLKVENLTFHEEVKKVNFELHKGEILGICGLSDAGIHEVGKVLFGLDKGATGTIRDMTTGKELKSAKDLLNAGGAYLSKDRDADGLMLHASIASNLTVPNAKRLSGRLGYLSPAKVGAMNEHARKFFEIKCDSVNSIVGSLSGGNKQKVNLSRWLVQDLKFIILDCPTRGVDIGVKAYIYGVLKEAKKNGMGIIMITDELTEAMGMADRILVMREHEQAGLLSRKTDFTTEKLGEVML
jgi:ribose transport system ATP-binding protein